MVKEKRKKNYNQYHHMPIHYKRNKKISEVKRNKI
jgi:hypothetical protein